MPLLYPHTYNKATLIQLSLSNNLRHFMALYYLYLQIMILGSTLFKLQKLYSAHVVFVRKTLIFTGFPPMPSHISITLLSFYQVIPLSWLACFVHSWGPSSPGAYSRVHAIMHLLTLHQWFFYRLCRIDESFNRRAVPTIITCSRHDSLYISTMKCHEQGNLLKILKRYNKILIDKLLLAARSQEHGVDVSTAKALHWKRYERWCP